MDGMSVVAASLPKCLQDLSAASRWMVMARWTERQGVYAKPSNPKLNLNLTFLDKSDRGGKVVTVQPVSHQINPPRDTTGQLALCWHPHEGNRTLNIWLLIDPVKKIYYKKKLCVKEYLNKACKIRALIIV